MRITRANWGLIFISLITIAVNIPYLQHNYYPVHDTLSVFQFFSYYYSQITQFNELPWWLPYTAYGMPIDSYLLFSFGPFQYLALTLGYIFHIQNTLLLFSLSLIGDTLFLALGSYYFCRHILRHPLATFICVISILLLVQYDRQIYWNFKILLPLPLALYFIQLSVERVNPIYLFMSLTTLLVWAFGSIPYVLPVQFYIVVMYGLCLAIPRFRKNNTMSFLKQISNTIKQPSNLHLLLLTSFIFLVCLYMLYHTRSIMSHEMAYNAIGRNANFGVDLDYYLNYGGNTGYEKLIELLNGLPTSHPHDFLAFVGLVNFILIAYGFLSRQRDKSQIALGITTLFIIAFSVTATGLAKLIYILPGMNMVRHIGYFITIAKLFLIILAGFGIRWGLSHEDSMAKHEELSTLSTKKFASGIILRMKSIQPKIKSMYIIPVLLSLGCLAITPLSAHTPYTEHVLRIVKYVLIFTIICSLFSIKKRGFVGGLILISLLEMITYRTTIYKMADLFLTPFPKEYIDTRAIKFQPERRALSSDYTKYKPLDMYAIGASYLEEDPCPASRQDLVAKRVKKLFEARQSHRVQADSPRESLDPKNDSALMQTLGCNTAKLRLTTQVQYANNSKTTQNLITSQNIYATPIITALPSHQLNTIHKELDYQITENSFSSNQLSLTVNNLSSAPAWLIYADAFNQHWQASVDNVAQAIFPANLAFKAIQIEPGEHQVNFQFKRPTTNFIIFWTLMDLLACVVLGIILLQIKLPSPLPRQPYP